MSALERWVLATASPGKLTELAALLETLAPGAYAVVAQSELGVRSPPETASTFVENALLKARHAAAATGLPAIADDSGLAVEALGGAPGVHSARYAGRDADDAANVAKLLTALERVPAGGGRRATFHCVLVALRHAADPVPLIAHGEWHGEIALEPRGGGGFGYDPVFVDPRLGVTAAEMSAAAKNAASHRGRAIARLGEMLQERRLAEAADRMS